MSVFLMPILNWLGGLLGGPFAKAAVAAYKAKLVAAGSHDAKVAELAGREITLDQRQAELNSQVVIAEQGNWMTRSVRPLMALPVIILLFKILVYDKALGQWTRGSTDALDPNLWGVMMCIIISYMGGRSAEKIADKIAGVWKK